MDFDLERLAYALDVLQGEVHQWRTRNFPDNPTHPLLGMVEELGELTHAHLKLEQEIRGDKSIHCAEKIDAIGDLVIYLADYCSQNRIALGAAVVKTWEQVQKRDWKKDPKAGGE